MTMDGGHECVYACVCVCVVWGGGWGRGGREEQLYFKYKGNDAQNQNLHSIFSHRKPQQLNS